MGQDSSTGPELLPDSGSIPELVERAFRYRGDVTLEMVGGGTVTGYLFNRNATGAEPFAQLFEAGTGREVTALYRDIALVRFTGRDAAAASVRRYEEFRRQ